MRTEPIDRFNIVVVLLASFLIAPFANAAQELESLAQPVQDEILRICLPVQYREGAAAYRNCVSAEIQSHVNDGNSSLDDLSFDEKYAIQQACAKDGSVSTEQYQNCIKTQIDQMQTIPEPALAGLSDDETYALQQSCFDAQSKLGAAAYRTCINVQLDSLAGIPAIDTRSLSTLEKNALQLRCSANTNNVANYRRCLGDEFESVTGTIPTFSTALRTTAPAVQQAAAPKTRAPAPLQAEAKVEAASQNPPTLQNNSVTAEVNSEPALAAAVSEQSLNTADSQNNTEQSIAAASGYIKQVLPRNIDPLPLNSEESRSDSEVSGDLSDNISANLAQNEPVLSEPSNSQIAHQQTVQSNTNDTATSLSVQPAEDLVISKPELVATLQQQANNPAPENENLAWAALKEKASSSWLALSEKITGLGSLGWIIIAGLLALPAALLALLSLYRRKASFIEGDNEHSLAAKAEEGMLTRRLRQEKAAKSLFHDIEDEHDIESHSSTLRSSHASQNAEHSYAYAHSSGMQSDTARIQHDQLAFENQKTQLLPPQPHARNIRWQSGFGVWLVEQPHDFRLQFSIEFLLYWMAYSDERYDPELKKRLFTARDLDEQDLIKRWVLKQDRLAFADVVCWMQTQTSQPQREQTLALLMALLIDEYSISPVQNTLLRFFADAFGIEKHALETRFEKSFGHPLPDLPRPDKSAWWAKQDDATIEYWEPQNLQSLPERTQLLAKFGLSDDADDTAVIQAFRRAARRCHPDRFSSLGNREHMLVARRFSRYEEARDLILGVSV